MSGKDNDRLPVVALLTIIAIVIPLTFNVGPLTLNFSRLLFLVLVPLLTINLLRGLYGRILITDVMVFIHVIWLALSIFINNADVAVQFTGSTAIAILGGYLAARASIRTVGQFHALSRLLIWIALFSLPFAVMETLTGKAILREILSGLPGMSVSGRATNEQRLGLYRVQFLFAHPIHYGFFCSLVFSLAYVGLRHRVGRTRRLVSSGIIGMCCFFSLASGAVLAMAIQIFLIGWEAVTRRLKRPWMLLISGSATVYVILELLSDRAAIIAILSRLAFSPKTVSIRQRLFEFGTEQIAKTPVFGVGYNDWGLPPWMSGSIDNFWLLQALIYGMPAFLGLVGATVLTMVFVGRRDFSMDEPLRTARLAWIFTMISMCLTLATVAVWGPIQSFVMFIIGAGVFLLTAEPAGETAEEATPQPRLGTRYTRFAPHTRPQATARQG